MKKMKNELVHQTIKKHNSVTDGYIPNTPKQVLPDKLVNILFYKFETVGKSFSMSFQEIKKFLGIKYKTGNIDKQIIDAIGKLKTEIVVKDVEVKGREAKWVAGPLINGVIIYKDRQNYVEFEMNEFIIDVLKQKNGYTPIDINISSQFKTKIGLKIYEMYRRYRNLPNRIENKMCVIEKSLDELNKIFSTNCKYPGELLSKGKTKKPINKALEEIKAITGVEITVFYSKEKGAFVFYWQKDCEPIKTIVPKQKIDEFAMWYVSTKKDGEIDSIKAYFQKVKDKLLTNSFEGIEQKYRTFLKVKYSFTDEDINNKLYDKKSGVFINFEFKKEKFIKD